MKTRTKLFMGVVVCLAVLILGVCTANDVYADTDDYVFSTYHGDLNNIKAPEKPGSVFAGWYDSDGNPAPKTATSGDYVAKFVDEDVLQVIWQMTKDTTKSSADTKLRLITSVDSLKYDSVGFVINGKSKTTKTVYTKLIADGEEYDPKSQFANDSLYFMTYVIGGVTNDANVANDTEYFGKKFTVTPQWTTLDGTYVEGKTRDIYINDELGYEARVENLTGAGNPGDKVWYGTLEDAVNAANDMGGATEGVVTVLQDAAIGSQLNLSKRNMTIQNRYGKDVTISRAEDFTGLMIYCSGSGKTQSLKTAEDDAEGSLTVNANATDAVSSSVVKLGSSTSSTVKFHLGEGVTITGANSDCSTGAVIYVQDAATAELHGNITNNISTSEASSLIHAAGTVNIQGGTYSGNNGVNGGVVYVTNNGKLTITDGEFTSNHANVIQGNNKSGNGGVVYGAGTVSIQGGEFTSNVADGAQGGGVVYTTKTLAISKGTFDNNQAYNGGVVFAAGTTTTISGGEFKNHTTMKQDSGSKGGVVFVNTGTLNITGGTFTSNSARLGGVVSNVVSTTVTFNGGTFKENSATGNGGVVFAQGDLTIKNGTFDSNKAPNGGVVNNTVAATIEYGEFINNSVTNNGGVVCAAGSLTIKNGKFDGNKAFNGGVVYAGASATIEYGEFTNNRVSGTDAKGGVVYVNANNLTIEDGTFTNNTAPWGGVAYNKENTTIFIEGGTFTENSATTTGGGVLESNKGKINICGTEEAPVVMKNNFVSSTAQYGGGAILLTNTATLTLKYCKISDNLHVGTKPEAEEFANTEGSDIGFRNDNLKTVTLLDESFEGVLKSATAMSISGINVTYNSSTWTIQDNQERYSVDYTTPALVKYVAE